MSDEEKLMDELEDLTGYYVNVGIGSYKNKDIAVIELWFNDMFAWAYSHAMTFMIPGVVTLEELNSKFKEWYEKEGKNILKRFDDVEYPEINKKGQSDNYRTDLWFIPFTDYRLSSYRPPSTSSNKIRTASSSC